ncbi:MAG TPA: ATP-binding protein [Caldilineaceae bacterium]|nr:ATP-binding protein [Caldilineaceae bacterium]
MLIEFTIGNYKSFKEKATLSMVATNVVSKDKSVDENNVCLINDDLSLLKSVAVYGANASGKSNLIAALRFMRRYVLDSSKESQSDEPIPVKSFRLSTETDKAASFFEVVFLLEGRQYRYGFEVDRERVISEWLYHVPARREAKLFERTAEGITATSVFKEGKDLESRTRDNALFLSVVAQFNGKLSQSILRWFRSLTIISGLQDSELMRQTVKILEDSKTKDEILWLIKELGVGIDDVRVQQLPFISSMPSNTPAELRSVFDDLAKLLAERSIHFEDRFEIQTVHRQYDATGKPVSEAIFDLETDESEGTKKIFALAGTVVSILQNGQILVIDELDARLHPLIIRTLINLFNSRQTNPQNAQLIFATHDTNLLCKELFRRDQIWFTEKDRFGATHLYSLVEYKVRNDASFESNYIQGRYGAIPYIGDLSQVLGDARA